MKQIIINEYKMKKDFLNELKNCLEDMNKDGYECLRCEVVSENDYFMIFMLTFEKVYEVKPVIFQKENINHTDGKSCSGCVHFDDKNIRCSILGTELKQDCKFRSVPEYTKNESKK